MPSNREMPSTLKRSPSKAQRTWRATHDRAVQEYGEGERAHRTAFAALKHSFKKVDDHWAPKAHKGPSDPRSAQPTTEAKRQGKGEAFGGVDYFGSSKGELYEQATRLGIAGRSKMNKEQLARSIAHAQRRH